jgi:hypothetical protein
LDVGLLGTYVDDSSAANLDKPPGLVERVELAAEAQSEHRENDPEKWGEMGEKWGTA